MRRGYDTLETEILGQVGVVVSELGVEEVFLTQESLEEYLNDHSEIQKDPILCKEAITQLKAYFNGERLNFDLNLVMDGTEFRKQVWKALRQIPYGEIRSYGDIAKSIGNPKAVRAVGGANKANPMPIFIPCHRVIGSAGKLVGFMGCRTDLQARLLEHEQNVIQKRYKKGQST